MKFDLVDAFLDHRIRDQVKMMRRRGISEPVLSDDGRPILTSVWCPSNSDLTEYFSVPFYKDIQLTGRTFPYVVRNLLRLYSDEGSMVYDPMMGTGTTLYEGTLLNRKVAGSDLHQGRVESFKERWVKHMKKALPKVALCSATDIPMKDASVDLLIMSFPWFTSWKFADDSKNESMDNYDDVSEFMLLTERIYTEVKRVLKPQGFCANILGNTYKNGVYYPITMKTMGVIEKVGLHLWYQFWNLRVDVDQVKFPWIRSGIDVKIDKAGGHVGWDVHEDIIIARKP